MLNWLNGRSTTTHKAEELYGKVVAAARQPAFYGPGRVADTPEGRFELVALHLFLIIERVKDVKPEGTEIARHMIEAFVTDMDDCMREMGVGDLTVPKRVKRAAAGFYERAGAFREGLSNPSNKALDEAVGKYTYQGKSRADQHRVLAAYVRMSSAALAKAKPDDNIVGSFNFPRPENFPDPEIQP